MNLLRKILLPIVPIYYIITWLRNKMYDLGIKKSVAYDFPVIAVGNLTVGGTGKSPMVEYLIRLLKDDACVATLSRGYKRETKGFQVVSALSTVRQVGDEPLQFKSKFKDDIIVGVDGDRRNGINRLRAITPKPEIIVLDDAYQHRKVKAGFYILLTSYDNLYCDDIMLPTGDLREPRDGASRADIIIVTKCPKNISSEQRNKIKENLKIDANQNLFFATIDYSDKIVNALDSKAINSFLGTPFTLITGIANPRSLVNYYQSLGLQFNHINFPDHHNFTEKELKMLRGYGLVVTTEKDYVRLASDLDEKSLWYQPIEMKFVENADFFDQIIIEYIKK